MINTNPTSKKPPRVIVAIFDGFDMLDITGPFCFFGAAGMNPILAGVKKTTYTAVQGVTWESQIAFADLGDIVEQDYIIWIPGGYGDMFNGQFYHGNQLLSWINKLHIKSKLNCSVCTGAHIAAAAGILKECDVTTHWAFKDSLSLFDLNIIPGFPRYHSDFKKNVFTGGGISSGLDESLAVISMVAGPDAAMSAQLVNQYQPDPPFNSGTPATAPTYIYNQTLDHLSEGISALNTAVTKFLDHK